MKKENIDAFLAEVIAIETEEAKQAGALGYMARTLVQATLPHRNPGNTEAWGRQNGYFSLIIQPGFVIKNLETTSIGLPYGSIPRLIIAWITTEAIRTKEKTLILGNSLSMFMRKLDLLPTGGKWGSINRIKEQTKRLFASKITCSYENNNIGFGLTNANIVDKATLWWHPKNPDQLSMFESRIELSNNFFNEIIRSPVPIDIRVLKLLKQSPMAIDIYCWLTYRMSYLKYQTSIPWEALQMQFGSDYADTNQGKQGFKRNFIKQLRFVLTVYPDANITCDNKDTIILKPGKSHILKTT